MISGGASTGADRRDLDEEADGVEVAAAEDGFESDGFDGFLYSSNTHAYDNEVSGFCFRKCFNASLTSFSPRMRAQKPRNLSVQNSARKKERISKTWK
jgi:hypothetical protein